MIVIGIIGYTVVAIISCACAQKGAGACKQISQVLCCCYYIPKCLCDLKEKQNEDEEADLNEAGIANDRAVHYKPKKAVKKSNVEEVTVNHPGETEDNWAEAANAEALADGAKSRQ